MRGGFRSALELFRRIRYLQRATRIPQLAEIEAEKHRLDAAARFVEVVTDCLSTRLSNYEEGLAPEVVAGFDGLG